MSSTQHTIEARAVDESSDSTRVGEVVDPEKQSAKPEIVQDEVAHSDDEFLVKFDKYDSRNPRNWSNVKRYYMVSFATTLNFLCTWVASCYSTGLKTIETQFSVSEEAALLGLSLFVAGFAVGPLFIAPLSEWAGRRNVYLVSWLVFFAFQFPSIFPPNIGGLLATRFIGGAAGSAPLANTGGVVHDLFSKYEDGMAMAIYALSSCAGPSLGNVLAGYSTQNKSLQISFVISTSVVGAAWFVILFTMPETRENVILRRLAAQKRKETGDDRWHSAQERQHHEKNRFWLVLFRPFRFLATEPLVQAAALYNGFTYGLIFLFNSAFGLIFGPSVDGLDSYGWTHPGTVDLTFLSIVLGSLIGFAITPFTQNAYFNRQLARQPGGNSVPEWRMWSSLVGCFLLPIGLFITAWTAYPGKITFIAPLIGATVFGLGFYILILAILAYIVDSYQEYAASALGGVVFVRNVAGAGFPLFGNQMYTKLNTHWATTLLALLALCLCPFIFMIFFYGKTLRARSPFAASHTL